MNFTVAVFMTSMVYNLQFFREDPTMTEDEISQMQEFEQMHGFNLDASDHSCPVRKAAFLFLHPTKHLDERYLKLLLDWLEHKVALIPFTQVADANDGSPGVYHVPEADLISDGAVLFIKLLNIEQQGPTRTVLNHFNRVGGQHPVGFLEDLVVEQAPSVELKAGNKTDSAFVAAANDAQTMCGFVWGQLENSSVLDDCTLAGWCSPELTPEKERTIAAQSLGHTLVNSLVPTTPDGLSLKAMFQASSASLDSGSTAVQVDPILAGHVNNGHGPVNTPQTASLQLPVPASASEAEILLNQHFDFASYWGPSLSLTRAERFDRGLRLKGVPPEWVNAVSEWVSAVLATYPELARLKRDQRIRDPQHQSARVQRVASDQARVESTTNKLIAETFQYDKVIPSLFESDTTLPLAECRATLTAVTEIDKSSATACDHVTDSKPVSGPATAKMGLYPIFVPQRSDDLAKSLIGKTRGSLKSTLRKSKRVGKIKPQHKPVHNTLLDSWCQSQPSESTDRSSSTQDEALPKDSNSTVWLDPCSPEGTDGGDPAPPIAPASMSKKPSRLYRV